MADQQTSEEEFRKAVLEALAQITQMLKELLSHEGAAGGRQLGH